jgi:hypothetical protein
LIPAGEQSGLLTRIAVNGKRFVVRADEKLTAFVELEAGDSGRSAFGWIHSLGVFFTLVGFSISRLEPPNQG